MLPLLLCLLSSPAMGSADSRNDFTPAFAMQVLVVGSENTAFNLHFIDELRRRAGPKIEVALWSPALAARKADVHVVVIALGRQAVASALAENPDAHLLALMATSDQLYDVNLDVPYRSAIFHDPPLLQQALLGRLILPQASRVALLVQPGHEPRYQSTVAQLAEKGFETRLFVVDGPGNLISGLSRALLFGDFILGTPDDEIYNPRTIKHILLTAYRRNRIVVGPSRPFVSAGALASSYTPLSVTFDETLRYLSHYQDHGAFPAPGWPERFAIDVNRQVAQSLNVPVPPNEQLETRLRRLMHENKGERDEE
ncbi:MAG: ABC transporter substrate-binding protein [Marinobacter sp.]|nr:ABC transporter substrate-binding protein [Marinobacter sp.]